MCQKVRNYSDSILKQLGPSYDCMNSTQDITQEEYDEHCYAYLHVYNNLIHDGSQWGGYPSFLYKDRGMARTTFENNVMYGTGGSALYLHCGKDNVELNNIVHKTSHLEEAYRGCEKGATTAPQE